MIANRKPHINTSASRALVVRHCNATPSEALVGGDRSESALVSSGENLPARFTLDSATLLRGDSFDLLEELPDASADAFITDPPFGTTAAKWDYQMDLARWWSIVDRKLKPTGVCVVFASGKFVQRLWTSNLKAFRYELVWEKSKAVGFLDANRCALRSAIRLISTRRSSRMAFEAAGRCTALESTRPFTCRSNTTWRSTP